MKNKRTIYVAVLFATFLFTTCGNKKSELLMKKESDSTKVKTEVKSNDSIKETTTLEMLQGKWQSTEDENSFIIFKGNYTNDYYEGIDNSSNQEILFRISENPITESNIKSVKDIENGKCISYGSSEGFNIIELTTEKLSISEINGRGNTLSYKKITNNTDNSNLSEYDKQILGTWTGTLSGSNLATRELVIVFTKSSFNQQKNFGNVEGYSTVNNKNKTPFIGTFFCDADTPVLELNEPKTSGTNGTFKISSLSCEGEESVNSDEICGTWSSYNGQLQREVRLNRMK